MTRFWPASIQSSTIAAADLMGWSDRVGSIRAGQFADLIAVQKDATTDVTVLTQVKFVMKGGVVMRSSGGS